MRAARYAGHRSVERRSRQIRSWVRASVRPVERCGRLEQSRGPVSPSAHRRCHYFAAAPLDWPIWRAISAWVVSASIRLTNSSRAAGVKRALVRDIEPSGVIVVVVADTMLAQEAQPIILLATSMPTTPCALLCLSLLSMTSSMQ